MQTFAMHQQSDASLPSVKLEPGTPLGPTAALPGQSPERGTATVPGETTSTTQPAADPPEEADARTSFIVQVAHEVVDPCLRPEYRLTDLSNRWTNLSFFMASRIFVKVCFVAAA